MTPENLKDKEQNSAEISPSNLTSDEAQNKALSSLQNGTIVICGGDTGGHLAVAKALNEELVSRGCRTIFVGAGQSQYHVWQYPQQCSRLFTRDFGYFLGRVD